MEDINQWREELETLHQRAETSLLIVDTMSGVLIESEGVGLYNISCVSLSVCQSMCSCSWRMPRRRKIGARSYMT